MPSATHEHEGWALLRQNIEDALKRDYYAKKECLLLLAMIMTFMHVLSASILMLVDLSVPNTSAVRIIAFYAVMIFILHPAGCAWVIVCSIAVGRWRGQKTYLKYIPWLVMIIAFGLLSMQPLWRVMYGLKTEDPLSIGAADSILFIIGMALLALWLHHVLWWGV